jgi:hypothetical protein
MVAGVFGGERGQLVAERGEEVYGAVGGGGLRSADPEPTDSKVYIPPSEIECLSDPGPGESKGREERPSIGNRPVVRELGPLGI